MRNESWDIVVALRMMENKLRVACWSIFIGEGTSKLENIVASGSVILAVGRRHTFRERNLRLGLQSRSVARGARRGLGVNSFVKKWGLNIVGRSLRLIEALTDVEFGADEMVVFDPKKR